MKAEGFPPPESWGVTILRVVVGIVFLAHGGQKLFIWGVASVAAIFAQVGIPAPMLTAVVVAMVEFLGGLALMLGLFTRWAAIPLAITMAGAIVTVHAKGGFFLPDGFEFVLTLLAANVALAFLGSGALSVDGFLQKRKA